MDIRLLLTGASGFVAGSVISHAPESWEIHAVSRSAAPVERRGLTWYTLDPLDTPRLRRTFVAVRPDAVLHVAAVADIDFCQAHRDLAWQVNVGLTRELARLCRDGGARLVFVSTDNVFDGLRGQYSETDPPSPVNYYGETKVEAEGAVLSTVEDAVVARTAIVVGLPLLGAGHSFLARMLRSWEKGENVGVPENEIRTPIDVVTLGRALLELAGNDFRGVLHLAGSESVNRFAMAQRIARRFAYRADQVFPNNPETIPNRAPRPLDASLDNSRARSVLNTPMRGLDSGLNLVMEARDGGLP